MKAIQFTGIRKSEITERKKPQITDDDDVLIRISHVSVCGSDIHYYRQGRIGSQVITYPFIPGHECSGYVEETGSHVTRVKQGDRIAIEPAVSCRTCDQCLAGRPHTCRSLQFLGCPGQLEGAMQEYIVMPERNCYPVKSNTSLVDAALAEPLSIGIYSVKQALLTSGDKVAIFGFGPIGMSVMLAAKAYGFHDNTIIDKIERRLETGKSEGAKQELNFIAKATARQILTEEPGGLDVVFECCGQQEAVDEAVAVLKPGGRFIIVGIPEFDFWQFAADEIRRKELTIINIRRQNDCVQEAIDLIESGRVSLHRMPTHFFEIDNASQAFDVVENYRDGVMKAVIQFS